MIRKCTILLLFISNSILVHAQSTSSNVDRFIKQIDSGLIEIGKTTANLTIKKKMGNRKIKMEGQFENSQISFARRIKYYRGGLKKEILQIKILTIEKPLLLYKIIRINDNYFYVKKVNYSDPQKRKRESQEILIDNRIYHKRIAGSNKEIIEWK